MTVSVKLFALLKMWLQARKKSERWCILITADPDALASAMAFKRILSRRVQEVAIFRTNEVTRPDNLAMIRYLRIPVQPWKEALAAQFDCFALLDSQPHHSPAYQNIPFDVVIDHHPRSEPFEAGYCDIQPDFGAVSTMMTRYLRALHIRPGRLLATALLYGIRTDTGAFSRSGDARDLTAYQWLSHHADTTLLRRIMRSEYLREWLPLFSRAFQNLKLCRQGAYVWVGKVQSGDQLVAIADFFTRVHGLKWIAVSGIQGDTLIVIFRGDGGHDVGILAASCFGDVGSAGGHRTAARAEIPLAKLQGNKVEAFVGERLTCRRALAAARKAQHRAASKAKPV